MTAGLAAAIDLAPRHRRRTAALIGSMSLALGAGAGPLLAGLTASITTSPQIPVFSAVGALTVFALVVAIRLPVPNLPTKSTLSRRMSWPTVPRDNRRHLLLGIVTFAPGVTSTSFMLSTGLAVLANGLGYRGPMLTGAIAFTMYLCSNVAQFVLANRSTRAHLQLSSVAAIASMAASVGSLTPWPSPFLFVLAAVTAGAAQTFGQLAGITLISAHVPDDRRAEANAVLNIAGYFPAGLRAVATGFAIDAAGLAPAVITFSTVVGASAACSLVLVRKATARINSTAGAVVVSDSESCPISFQALSKPDCFDR
nr:MFS transporter [Rhodococcus sp. 06-621-2]